MKKIKGKFFSSIFFKSLSVPTSIPATASITITAQSTACTPLIASPIKSEYPGVSIRLIIMSL